MPVHPAQSVVSKQRQRAMWASGDFARVSRETVGGLGAELVEACGVRRGQRVLDVAAGTGNAAIPAAATGADASRRTSRPSCSPPAARRPPSAASSCTGSRPTRRRSPSLGPVIAAYAHVAGDAERTAGLTRDLLDWAQRMNRDRPPGQAVFRFEYVLVVATRF